MRNRPRDHTTACIRNWQLWPRGNRYILADGFLPTAACRSPHHQGALSARCPHTLSSPRADETARAAAGQSEAISDLAFAQARERSAPMCRSCPILQSGCLGMTGFSRFTRADLPRPAACCRCRCNRLCIYLSPALMPRQLLLTALSHHLSHRLPLVLRAPAAGRCDVPDEEAGLSWIRARGDHRRERALRAAGGHDERAVECLPPLG